MIVPDLIKAVEAGQEKARLEIQGKHRMNERIKELAEQANILIGKDSYGKFAVIPGHEKDPISRLGKAESYNALEKFAELIVAECADIVEAQKESLADDESDWSFRDFGYEAAVNDSVEMIKQHFGVEE